MALDMTESVERGGEQAQGARVVHGNHFPAIASERLSDSNGLIITCYLFRSRVAGVDEVDEATGWLGEDAV
jgi:hypothetical protein